MKKITSAVALVLFLFASQGFAEIMEEPVVRDLPGLGITFGFETYYLMYEEPNVMEQEGMMYGIVGSWTHRDNVMLRLEGRFSYGQVDYTSNSTGSMDSIDDYILEFRGLVGKDFKASETTTLTPYVGGGYRYLNDDSSGMRTSTGHLGYGRESNYFYSPLGLEAITDLNNAWSAGLTLEYDYLWKGIQKSHLSDANLGFNDLENDQNDGYGLRGSLKLQKKGVKRDLVLEAFIRYWDIDNSETTAVTYSGVIIGYGYEPKNTTTEYGIKCSTMF